MEFHDLTLDPFQEQAIRSVDEGHTVLVGAPTGTGKTLIAEYAVERCLARGERAIYTAPIKALSNQKFHDFHARYGSRVGILTGDVSINAEADAVVMTTEILRNTMLEDPLGLHDVAYIVFDEVHYVNDIERGTVWEESVILCPQHIAFVCLSATAPNIEQFAGWIRSVHKIPVDVVVEDKRAVPVEKAFFAEPMGLCDFDTLAQAAKVLKAKKFDLESFGKEWARRTGSKAALPQRRQVPLRDRHRRRPRRREDTATTLKMIDHLASHDRLPCLFFSPVRRLCEERARYLAAHYRLAPEEEARVVEHFDRLAGMQGLGEEKALLQMRELVKAGVAFHHAGVLPALKQVVERMFATGQLRALFATETFAVGVNMPARSVAFDGFEKFDGFAMRPLMAREFQQMSGRAGRRGIDERGYVYVQADLREFNPGAARHSVFGKTEPIDSQFDLGYSSILNLYEQFGEGMYDIARKSFAYYQATGGAPNGQEQALDTGSAETRSVPCGQPERLAALQVLRSRLSEAKQRVGRARRATRRAGRRGGGKPAEELNAARVHYEELRAQLAGMACERCREKRSCSRAAQTSRRRGKRRPQGDETAGRLADRYGEDIRRRFRFLDELGYVADAGLTDKGRVARHLFGYEIQVAELLFAGFFEKLDEVDMSLLVAAIVFEAKKSAWYREPAALNPMLKRARKLVDRLYRRERQLGLPSGIKRLDLKLSATVQAWCCGEPFDALAQFTSSSDGDLVRTLRLILDLYRQIKRAVPEHASLVEKINRAIDLIKRPPVDPEWELTHAEEDRGGTA